MKNKLFKFNESFDIKNQFELVLSGYNGTVPVNGRFYQKFEKYHIIDNYYVYKNYVFVLEKYNDDEHELIKTEMDIPKLITKLEIKIEKIEQANQKLHNLL